MEAPFSGRGNRGDNGAAIWLRTGTTWLSAGLGLGTLGQMGIARGTLLAARFGDPSQRRVVRPRFRGFTLVSSVAAGLALSDVALHIYASRRY